MQTFLSYQTEDREVAFRVAKVLKSLAAVPFLAHEDINASLEWRIALLKQLQESKLFVPILSRRYFSSVWCAQESGIAAHLGLVIVPLAIDETKPEGFIAHIQSTRIDPNSPPVEPLVTGMAQHDRQMTIHLLIKRFAGSRDYRSAESNFKLLEPLFPFATERQYVAILTSAAQNPQIWDAADCARLYLPPLYKRYGKLLGNKERITLRDAFKSHNVDMKKIIWESTQT